MENPGPNCDLHTAHASAVGSWLAASDILERSVHAVAEQAANTNKVIDEAMEAGLAADHPSQCRSEASSAGTPEGKGGPGTRTREAGPQLPAVRHGGPLGSGISMADPGHWGHRFPAPHGEPAV
jgi:hypothetical protein